MEPKHRKEGPGRGYDRDRKVAEARKIIESLTPPAPKAPERKSLRKE